MAYIKRLTTRTKLIIYEYKEIHPEASPELVSELFNVSLLSLVKLFNDEYIYVPSKINKL